MLPRRPQAHKRDAVADYRRAILWRRNGMERIAHWSAMTLTPLIPVQVWRSKGFAIESRAIEKNSHCSAKTEFPRPISGLPEIGIISCGGNERRRDIPIRPQRIMA
jgi:hypothetical protein